MNDILVIGGGLMGCSVAWKLAQRGRTVTVLERAIPGAEASSAAAGILAPGTECWDQPELFRLATESLARYPIWEAALKALNLDIQLRLTGLLHLAVDPDGLELHQRMAHSKVPCLSEPPFAVPWLSPNVRGMLWFPEEGSVDNRLLMTAVRSAAEQAGVRFVLGHEVQELLWDGDRCVGVSAHPQDIVAKETVVCAGAWTSALGGPLRDLGIIPIKGQMMAIQGANPCVTFAHGLGYLVPRHDRTIVGSTTEDVGFDRSLTAEGIAHLANIVHTTAPNLANNPVLEMWCGFRPTTPNKRPVIGRLGDRGPWVASGHYRHGILLTPITAELLSAMICGESPPTDPTPFTP